VKKTAAEIKALNASHGELERLRKQRRAEQEANVARKKGKATVLGTGNGRTSGAIDIDDDDDKRAGGETSSEEDDDAEWDDEEAINSSASEGPNSLSGTDDEDTQVMEARSKPPPLKRTRLA
jgi:ribosome biogenesis protein SSF1/2